MLNSTCNRFRSMV